MEGRAYLNAEQLAAITPWTAAAIRRMVARGLLKRGLHYFQPLGIGSQLIFKWTAIVDLIEQERVVVAPSVVPPPTSQLKGQGGGLDVEAATRALQRLLD